MSAEMGNYPNFGLVWSTYKRFMLFYYNRLANHEKSKKHKENVAILREEMLADDEALDLLSSDPEMVEEQVSQPAK